MFIYYIHEINSTVTMWLYRIVLCFIVLRQDARSQGLDCERIQKFTECHCDAATAEVICHGSQDYNNNTALLADMPSEVKSLTVTGFNTSQISKISPCLLPMQLKFLNLSNNNIEMLHSSSFKCMPDLESLILANNLINIYAPTEIFNNSLSKLRVLDLESAFIGWLNCSRKTVGNCNESIYVKLSWYVNGIGNLTSLQELNLASNRIWSIPSGIQTQLGQLSSLRLINFSGNSLTFPKLDKGLLNLEDLELSNNRIPYLKDTFLDDLTRMSNLKRLYLRDNLFKCDCEIKNFIMWLQNRSQSYFVQEPESLICFEGYGNVSKGEHLINITVSDLSCQPYDFPKTANFVMYIVLIVLIVSAVVVILILNRSSVKRLLCDTCTCNGSRTDREYSSLRA